MKRAFAPLVWRLAFAGTLATVTGCIDAVVGQVDVCKVDGGQGYALGEKFTAPDGCNTCTCEVSGQIACTEIACDNDAGAPSGSCRAGGKLYKIGESFKADDGCNTCQCTAQGAACTLIGCLGPSEVCKVGDQTYFVGQDVPSKDGCNQCTCTAGGTVACTDKACAPGSCTQNGTVYQNGQSFSAGCNSCFCKDGQIACTAQACVGACTMGNTQFGVGVSVPCDDGCNSCTCTSEPNGSYSWAQTLIGCPAVPKIEKCNNDSAYLDKSRVVYLSQGKLAVEATFAGCANEGQKFKLCYDGAFRESFPVQTSLYIVNTSTPTCSSLVTGTRVFDLAPLADLYLAQYGSKSGSISVQLEKGDSVLYSF